MVSFYWGRDIVTKVFTYGNLKRILRIVASKNKKYMLNHRPHKSFISNLRSTPVLAISSIVVLCAGFIIAPKLVRADAYQAQINALSQQNSSAQNSLNNLEGQASNYQQAINNLQAQINGLQSAIAINQAKQTSLQTQIANNQAELVQEKSTLADVIKTMYVSGQLTPVEMLATSNNISTYIDQQAAYNDVQQKIQDTVVQINKLQAQLQQQKQQLTIVVNSEQQQANQLASAQNQQQQLLSYNQSQQAAYTSQIQSNNSQIATLKAEQLAANRRLVSTGQVDYSGSCGGSYPLNASGPYGNWGCDYGLDSSIDNWGMYNRECVSYTAWMVYKTYGYMPYWGGSGDAYQWVGDATAAGIPVGSTPKVGSVAIYMGGGSDPLGHAMWVKSVNSDGTITVDQYNLYYDGNFYETTISASGLTYIYFGG
ncbi:MAG: CHAP domain-containing protein [Candidatus Saccharimonadales bacterium]